MLRKRVGPSVALSSTDRTEKIDIAAVATALVTSEHPAHPVENAFDGRLAPGGSRWVAGEPGEQVLTLVFDAPQTLKRIGMQVEETEVARCQELSLSASCDGGDTYRDVLRQEFNFSPPTTTVERED